MRSFRKRFLTSLFVTAFLLLAAKISFAICSPSECPPTPEGFKCQLGCLVPNGPIACSENCGGCVNGVKSCRDCGNACGRNCTRFCSQAVVTPPPSCTGACLVPLSCSGGCPCNGNCQNGVCTSGCGGPGLWKQYLWVHKSNGSIASNNSSCSNFLGNYGFSVTGLTCSGNCAGATTLANLSCQQSACGGMRCDVVSAAGRTYRMTARIMAPSGFSLSRADWWTESQSGSGGTATFNVSDGTNFNFVPYFDFVKIRTRTVLQISDDPAKSARITCIYLPSN